jgi:Zn-finger protein
LGVGQGLESLITLQKSINSHCLMTLGDFIVGDMVTGLHVASCNDVSFVHQSEATECVSAYCLVSEGSWSGSDSL